MSAIAKVIILGTLIFSLALPAVASAATPGITPRSMWYRLDLFFERVALAFSFNTETKEQKRLAYAEERLAEAEEVAREKDSAATKTAIDHYETLLKETDINSETTKEAVSKHTETLKKILEIVPEEGKSGVQNAIEAYAIPAHPADSATSTNKKPHTPNSSPATITVLSPAESSLQSGTSVLIRWTTENFPSNVGDEEFKLYYILDEYYNEESAPQEELRSVIATVRGFSYQWRIPATYQTEGPFRIVVECPKSLTDYCRSGTSRKISFTPARSAETEDAYQLLTPKTGVQYNAGEVLPIRWKGGTPESKIQITLYHAIEGTNYLRIVDQFQNQYDLFDADPANRLSSLQNTGNLDWKIPKTLGGTYRIAINCSAFCPRYHPANLRDTSGTFRIMGTNAQPFVANLFYNEMQDGDPILFEGKTYTVSWAIGNPPANESDFEIAITLGDNYGGRLAQFITPFSKQSTVFALTIPAGTGSPEGNKKWLDICLQQKNPNGPTKTISCDRGRPLKVKN